MDIRHKQIIRTNQQYICDNIDLTSILDYLISGNVISIDDLQRINKEASRSKEVEKMLRIIEMHPKGYDVFLSTLRDVQASIADRLEATPVNEDDIKHEQDEVDISIKEILRKKFISNTSNNIPVKLVEEKVEIEFRMIGEHYNVHIDHLKRLVIECFPGCTCKKSKKRKELCFQNLRKAPDTDDEDESDDGKVEADIDVHEASKPSNFAEQSIKSTEKVQVLKSEMDAAIPDKSHIQKELQNWSALELADYLTPRLEEHKLPLYVVDTIQSEKMDGKHFFKKLKPDYAQLVFPELTRMETFSMLCLRDEIWQVEEDVQNDQMITLNETKLEPDNKTANTPQDELRSKGQHTPVEFGGNFRETFRNFDRESNTKRNSYMYKKNAILTSYNVGSGNLLDPVHIFLHSNKPKLPYDEIGHEVAEFAAACLNERSNGTIHFGVKSKSSYSQIEGEILGLPLERELCLNRIDNILSDRFYKEQIPLVLKCIRRPQFIEVTSSEKLSTKLWVLEVDVVPHSTIVGDEAFFIKKRKGSGPLLYLFKEEGVSPQCVSDERSITFMSKHKNRFSEMRKEQEETPKRIAIKYDLRQKILDLLNFGEESMSSVNFPLLFLSPLDSSIGNSLEFGNIDFMIELDANAVFDFDYILPSNKGIFEFLETDKEQVFKALTTDNFDPNSEENQVKKESHSNLLEDIHTSVIKPWIFCNGYEPLSKVQMNIMDWKQNRSKGFKEAIRFFRNEIPLNRGLVFFFLFSKDYETMLDAANDVIIEFKYNWVVFAENNDIANHWCDELSRRHIADKETVNQRTVIGMPWSHVNNTIKQLYGSHHSLRCEIPTSSGAFCYLKEKKRNELYDLDILSRNECEDDTLAQNYNDREKVRREVEEKFYKGGNVSWWNFWFADHVFKRDVHDRLKEKVIDALEGKRLDDENKIGLVNIFHQPGAGGSTTARHILWDLRTKYRCCIIKHITDQNIDQTIDQITTLRIYEENEDPKPPLVLIENRDEERTAEIITVLQHKARIAARRNTDVKVFCVLLLCTRKVNIPQTDISSRSSEFLKQELSKRELIWFSEKHSKLENRFKEKDGPDPRFLISFNILKENFNADYIRDTSSEFVKGVTDESERKLLKYLSLLNTFDLEWSPIQISAFDPIMMSQYKVPEVKATGRTKLLNKLWEQVISQPLQILLNRNIRAGVGQHLPGLSMINSVFAEEILKFFKKFQKLSEIVFELFDTPMFKSNNMAMKDLERVIRNIMIKREDKDEYQKMKFSPLIMRLLEEENEETATRVLKIGFEITQDAMICQQVARLYIHCKNWKEAARHAQMATDMKPYNSFLWDTYGQVYMKQLFNKYEAYVQERKTMSPSEIEEVIEIAQNGMLQFQKEQEVSGRERQTKVNDAGYYGELNIIILLLDTLRFSPIGRTEHDLHTYLVDKDYELNEMPQLSPESTRFLKSLGQKAETTMKMIEDKTTQFKDDKNYAAFNQENSRHKRISNIRENLGNYFGEDSDTVPEHYSVEERADFRRRRVRRLGGRTLYNFLRIDKQSNLEIILDLLLENMNSRCWEPFDAVSLINAVLAMKILKIRQSKVKYIDLVHMSRKCYDKVVTAKHGTYLEAYMYFILFNWPTDSRHDQIICPVEELKEAIKNWNACFHSYHPRQKEGKPVRRRATTIFFLGKGKDMDTVVHYDDLVDPQGKKFVRGDKVWESEDFVNKLLHLPGTLVHEGADVSYQMEQRAGGITSFQVSTSFPIGNRLLWQKRVFFVLAFSWAGIKAYDVRQDKPQVSARSQSQPMPIGAFQISSKKQQIQTHESIAQELLELDKSIDDIDRDLGQPMRKDKRKKLKQHRARQEKKKKDLLKSRGEFFGT